MREGPITPIKKIDDSQEILYAKESQSDKVFTPPSLERLIARSRFRRSNPENFNTTLESERGQFVIEAVEESSILISKIHMICSSAHLKKRKSTLKRI